MRRHLTNCELAKLLPTENVYYDLDKSFIRPDAAITLDKLAAFLKQYPQISVIASSHTDSRASQTYNVGLSMRRSQSSKEHLVRLGIDPGRIQTAYHGEGQLVNHCADGVPCPEEHQQLNRRTEFYFLNNNVRIECSDK